MTDTSIQDTIQQALTRHSYAGTVDGPGYRAVVCRCRREFTTSGSFAVHQANHVTLALGHDLASHS